MSVRKLLKEPLLHFLAGAALIFAYFWLSGASRDPDSYEINISSSDIDRIAADAIRTSNRLPTHDEIEALIEQNIREEIFYREALRLGLDDGDAVIRRRLANKMRSLNNDEIDPPTDAQLQKWMDDNPNLYAASHLYAFEQIYIGRDSSPEDQKQWLTQLNENSIKPERIRAILSIESIQALSNESAIKRKFGDKFMSALQTLKFDKAANQWQGPIESGFGLHFIKIEDKQSAEGQKLEDIRQRITNDWLAHQKIEAEKQSYDRLAQQYEINVAPFK